jgi:hypothetical protein
MAAGTPVVADDAPGVREIVRDGINGRLLPSESQDDFVAALRWLREKSPVSKAKLASRARRTADEFSISSTTKRVLNLYEELVATQSQPEARSDVWQQLVRRAAQECRLWTNVVEAGATAAFGGQDAIYSRE